MKTITIGRQYGSGGREVGAMLAKSLNIPFYDSNLLLIAAEKYGINPGVMAEHDEKKQSSFLYGISMIADGYLNQEKIMLPYKLYQAQSDDHFKTGGGGALCVCGAVRRTYSEKTRL